MQLEKNLSNFKTSFTKTLNDVLINSNKELNFNLLMYCYKNLISDLDTDHKKRLNWFYDKKKTISGYPKHKDYLLACKPKGIYKPATWKYALSISQRIKSPYWDIKPVYDNKGNWVYKYYQEGFDNNNNLYTNIALQNNMNDKIPVGVCIQLSGKPNIKYEYLGCGIITSYDRSGYFNIVSCN